MVRLLTPSTFVAGVLLSSATVHADEADERHHFLLQVDVSYTTVETPLTPWVDGGIGKLRYGDDGDGFTTPRSFAQYRGWLTPTLFATAIVDYVDDASGGLDVSEAYLHWRPVPESLLRTQWKLGVFYPPVSLENTAPGWTSPYTFSNSAINTWIGEEVRTLGVEWSATRPIGRAGSPHHLKVLLAAFYGNDPVGTLIAFKGWSSHDRQTRLFDRLPLPNGDTLEPFDDLDQQPGYYAGLEWRNGQRVKVTAMYYDNRADPAAFSNGQWGWDTRFTAMGAQIALPWKVGAVTQWLAGDTLWIVGAAPSGEITGSGQLINTHFESSFLLLTKEYRNHRVSVRYDDFEVLAQAGQVDDGHVWTLSYRYQATHRLLVGAEWLRIDTWHPYWAVQGVNPGVPERQVQLRLSLRLGETGR